MSSFTPIDRNESVPPILAPEQEVRQALDRVTKLMIPIAAIEPGQQGSFDSQGVYKRARVWSVSPQYLREGLKSFQEQIIQDVKAVVGSMEKLHDSSQANFFEEKVRELAGLFAKVQEGLGNLKMSVKDPKLEETFSRTQAILMKKLLEVQEESDVIFKRIAGIKAAYEACGLPENFEMISLKERLAALKKNFNFELLDSRPNFIEHVWKQLNYSAQIELLKRRSPEGLTALEQYVHQTYFRIYGNSPEKVRILISSFTPEDLFDVIVSKDPKHRGPDKNAFHKACCGYYQVAEVLIDQLQPRVDLIEKLLLLKDERQALPLFDVLRGNEDEASISFRNKLLGFLTDDKLLELAQTPMGFEQRVPWEGTLLHFLCAYFARHPDSLLFKIFDRIPHGHPALVIKDKKNRLPLDYSIQGIQNEEMNAFCLYLMGKMTEEQLGTFFKDLSEETGAAFILRLGDPSFRDLLFRRLSENNLKVLFRSLLPLVLKKNDVGLAKAILDRAKMLEYYPPSRDPSSRLGPRAMPSDIAGELRKYVSYVPPAALELVRAVPLDLLTGTGAEFDAFREEYRRLLNGS